MKRIQLLGTQRSGSNMLRLMLGQLSAVLTPPSAHELRDFQPLMDRYVPLDEAANMRRLVGDLGRLIDLNALPWPRVPNRSQRVMKTLAGNTLAHAVIAFYDAHAEFFYAKSWVSKCLENVHYVDQLFATRLPVAYVHLVRDPRDVAASFISAPIGPKEPRAIALSWRQDQLAAERAHAIVGDQHWHMMRYEDLVTNPRSAMGEFCSAVGLDWSDSALNFYSSKAAITAARISDLWKNLDRPIDQARIGTHATQLDESTIGRIEGITRDLMEQFQYEPYTHGPIVIPDDTEKQEISGADAELRNRALTGRDPESEQLHLRRDHFLKSLKN